MHLNLSPSDKPLADLAGRLDDIFQLDNGTSGGICCIGAYTQNRTFGLTHHGSGGISFAGRGRDMTQAFLSCIGEAAERLSFYERENDPLIQTPCPWDVPKEHRIWAENLCGGTLTERPSIAVCSGMDAGQGYAPIDLFLRRPPVSRNGLRPASSTGLACGPDEESALQFSILEAIERDAVALWWWGGMPGQRFSDLRSEGNGRNTWFLDVTTDLGVPVVVALSASEQEDAIVLGHAAGQTRDAATERAYLEMRQMEISLALSFDKLKSGGLAAVAPGDRTNLDRAVRLSLQDYPWLAGESGRDIQPNLAAPQKDLRAVLTEKGFTPIWANLTRADIGCSVVKTVIPELQDIDQGFVTARLAEMQAKTTRGFLKNLPPLS